MVGLNRAVGLCHWYHLAPRTSLCGFIFTLFLYSVTFFFVFPKSFLSKSLAPPFLCVIYISLVTFSIYI